MKKLLLTALLGFLAITGWSQTWTKVGNMPIQPRFYSVSLTYNNSEYIVNGSLGSNIYTDTMWQYTPSTNTWKFVTVFPGGPRIASIGFVIGNKAYVGLGEDDNTYALHDDFYSYDFAANTWTQLANYPGGNKDGAAAFAIGNIGYVVGGGLGSAPYTSTAYSYNIITNVWSTLPSMPITGVEGPATFAINGIGYVAGGYYNPANIRKVIKFDTSAKKWINAGNIPDSDYSGQSVFSVCGKLYVVTGEVNDTVQTSTNKSNAVFIYDPILNTWTRQSTFPGNKRDVAVAFTINGIGYLMSGRGANTIYNDIWKFTPSVVNPLSIDDTTVCTGSSVTINPGIHNATYLWSTKDTTHTLSIKTGGKYWVQVVPAGCQAFSDTFNVKAKISPTATTGADTTVCIGNSVVLKGSGGISCIWSPTTGLVSSDTAYHPTTKPSATITYTITVKDTNGCTNQATQTVTINNPKAPSVVSPVIYCQNTTDTALHATGSNLLWYSTATGGKGNTVSPIPSTTTVDTTKFYVSQTVSGCVSPRDSVTVIIKLTPKPPVVTSPINYCVGMAAPALTANGSSLLWYSAATGGKGNTTAPIPSTSAVSSTLYYVSQTINGCESQRNSIKVVDTLDVFSIPNTAFCSGSSVTIKTVIQNATYLWSTKDTTHTLNITAGGKYWVKVVPKGCQAFTDTFKVRVKALPQVAAGTDTTVCIGNSVVLTGSGGVSCVWSPVTGLVSPDTAYKPTTTPVATVTYTITVTDTNGCTNSAHQTVSINNPKAPSVVSPVIYCQYTIDSALHATGSHLLWYGVNKGGIGDTMVPIPITSGVDTTEFYVSQTISGCESPRDSIKVIIKLTPTPPVVTSPVNYCEGMTASALSATGSNLLWYASAIGGKSSVKAPVPSTSAVGSKTYYLSQTINGCESQRDSITVVDTIETLTIIPLGKTTFCESHNVVLSTSGSDTYAWSNKKSGADDTVSLSGKYSVTSVANNGCKGASQSITVRAMPPATDNICILTVDTLTGKNLIIWQKTINVGTAHYNVYKESNQAGVYTVIGVNPFDSLSEYVDTASQPLQQSSKYYIASVDTCGNEDTTAHNFVHESIHLNSSVGTSGENNLSWNAYVGFPYSSYYIYRSTNNGVFSLINTISSSNTTYSDLTPPAGTNRYFVAIEKSSSCTPTRAVAASLSNFTKLTTGINSITSDMKFDVFPNPSNGDFTVDISGLNMYTLNVYDVLGRTVISKDIQSSAIHQTINLNLSDKGVYFITLRNNEGLNSEVKKLIVQ